MTGTAGTPLPPYFLGVDGGGSKTDALILDGRGMVLGKGRSGRGNYHTAGMAEVIANARSAIGQAVAEAQTSGADLSGTGSLALESAAFCMAGADLPQDFTRLREAFTALPLGCSFEVYNDVIGIFRAGSRFPYGVGVVCGTGFNAGGVDQHGRELRFPALGGFTGDRAGGDHLAIEAVGAAFRAWDGRGAPTLLEGAILRLWQKPDYLTLAADYENGTISADQMRALVPLLFETAAAGDALAQGIIREQGLELSTAALTMLRCLDLLGTDCDVVLGGGVFRAANPLLTDTIRDQLASAAPQVVVQRLNQPPVVGAALLAADRCAYPTGDGFLATLRKQMAL
ncbi:MAG TPA: BadF/BadG/BcrA/BcrD ATPase family protein [Aggregatilineales bacterium]|nr:ATPase [Anaerolineales bacterium]HRE46529.1 BadF/BadG/BcrA/BcrD ATPase family protein [Aggregatilineales bacterium]